MTAWRDLRPFVKRARTYGTVQHWRLYRPFIVPNDLLPFLLENALRQCRATIRKRFLRGYYTRCGWRRCAPRESIAVPLAATKGIAHQRLIREFAETVAAQKAAIERAIQERREFVEREIDRSVGPLGGAPSRPDSTVLDTLSELAANDPLGVLDWIERRAAA